MPNYSELGKEYFSQIEKTRELLENPRSLVLTGFNQTLFDTSSFRVPTMQMALKRMGLSQNIPLLRGNGDRNIMGMSIYLGDGGDSHLFDQANEVLERRQLEMQQLVEGKYDLTEYLTPGALELIRSLRKSGKTAIIATDAADEFVDAFLQKTYVDNQPISPSFSKKKVRGSMKDRANSMKAEVESRSNPLNKIVPTLIIGDNKSDADLAVLTNTQALIVTPDHTERAKIVKSYGVQQNIVMVSSLEEVFNGR